MNWKDEAQNIERKLIQEEIAFRDKINLTFVQVDEGRYRVYNKKTRRFHDLELGIDVVT